MLLKYTGTEHRRILRSSDFPDFEDDFQDLVWERGAGPVEVSQQVWEAMQAKGLGNQFREVTQEELDASTADQADQDVPSDTSGLDQDSENEPDDEVTRSAYLIE